MTAIECRLTTRLRFGLRKEYHLANPRIETADALMTLAAAPTVEEAARACVRDMVQLICEQTGLGRSDAYALASVAVDLRINQVVNRPMVGVRAVLPRAVLPPVPR